MRGYTQVRLLTLRSAWIWSVLAWCILSVVLTLRWTQPHGNSAAATALSFLAACLLLAPLTAALGARRPGCRAWPWFVVLPMLLVLQWPIVWQVWQTRGRGPIEIGVPAIGGFITVLLMGFGNYFGTGNTLAAILIAVASILLMLPATGWDAIPIDAAIVAPMLLAGALELIYRRNRYLGQLPALSREQAAQKLWLMFRDQFGVLWARRVIDRMAVFERRERWATELSLDGFTHASTGRDLANPVNGGPPLVTDVSDFELKRPLEVLCWLLRRFADAKWLQQQLGDFCPDAVQIERLELDAERTGNGVSV